MARWVSGSGKWMDCHCVLTRCGFLHWFSGSPPDPAEIVPVDSLNLSRQARWLHQEPSWPNHMHPAAKQLQWTVLLTGV